MSYEVLRSCMEVYQEKLEELEIVVLESKVLGSVVVMGDFNAHLGILAGVRGQGGPNMHCYCCYGSGFTPRMLRC